MTVQAVWEPILVDVDAVVAATLEQSAVFSLAAYVSANSSLNGDRFRTYSSVDAAQVDVTAGYLSSDAFAAVQTAFDQEPTPASFAIIRVTLATPETYADALAAAVTGGLQFLYYAIDARDGTNTTDAAGFLTGRRKIMAFQDGAAGWYASGTTYPAGYTTLNASNQILGVFNATDTQHSDVAIMARASAVDPDVACFSFCGPMGGDVTVTNLTDAQRDLVLGREINLGLPYTERETVPIFRQGTVTSGEKAYATLTKFWTEIRLAERILQWFAEYDAAGHKVPGGAVGEAAVYAICAGFITEGAAGPSPHFGPTDSLPNIFTLTVAFSAGTITVTGRVGLFDATDFVDISLTLIHNV